MYKVFREYFDDAELLSIERLILPGNRWEKAESISRGDLEADAYGARVADLSSISPNHIPEDFRNKLMHAVQDCCPGEYRFMEAWSINRYRAEMKGHFYWHKDRLDHFNLLKEDMDRRLTAEEIFIKNTTPHREMSVSIALNDRSEYNGGQFIIDQGDGEKTPLNLDRGDVVVFDSDTYHGVEDVTDGERLALIIWLIYEDAYKEWKEMLSEENITRTL